MASTENYYNFRGVFMKYRFINLLILGLIALPLTLLAENKKIENEDSLKVYQSPSITVTSTKAKDRVNPVTFSDMENNEIKMTHTVRDVPEMLTELPSITSYSQSGNNIGYSYLTMRGFDQRRISVMVNGIPQNDPEDHEVYWINMADLSNSMETIQVQRGAGLINYGAAAIGGSINLSTTNIVRQKAGAKFYSGVGVQQFGSSDVYQANVSKVGLEYSSGKVGKYSFYTRLSQIKSDGYRNNTWSELNGYFVSVARFDEKVWTQINVFGGPISDGLSYVGLPKSYIGDLDRRRHNYSYWDYNGTGDTVNWASDITKQDVEGFSQPHYEILNDWFVSDNITIKSSLFYYTGDGFFDYGAGWADDDLNKTLDPEEGEIKGAFVKSFVGNKHGGWIPRMIWDHDLGELTVGAEMRWHRSEHWGKIIHAQTLPENFDMDWKFYSNNGQRETFSIFAREMYKFANDFTINIEGQLVHQTYGLNDVKNGDSYADFKDKNGDVYNGGDLFKVNYLFFNPRFGVNYNHDEHNSFYGLVAYTSREPRMKNLFAADESYSGAQPKFESDTNSVGQILYDYDNPLVKPESLLDFELGWKHSNRNYFASANLYWMEFFDELVKNGQLDVFGRPKDGNAPRTRHYGVELVGGYVFEINSESSLTLTLNATYSQNKVIDFTYFPSSEVAVILDDNNIAGFPDIMGGGRVTYKNKKFSASVFGRFVGESRTDNFGTMLENNNELVGIVGYRDNLLDAYTVFNADVSYTFENVVSLQTLRVHAHCYNLLNELYAAGAVGKDFFPAAERSFYFGIELGI
jgi:iron complex outermembrane recepter protein